MYISVLATNFDRIPKFAPEDLNFCTVAERQQQTEAAVHELAAAVASLPVQPNPSSLPAQLDGCLLRLEDAVNKLTTVAVGPAMQPGLLNQSQSDDRSQRIEDAVNKMAAVVAGLPAHSGLPNQSDGRRMSVVRLPSSMSPSSARRADRPEPDRSRNVVMFGIPENDSPAIWQQCVSDVLAYTLGHSVQVADTLRLGRPVAGKVRPILVCLQSAWDRRLILSSTACLRDDARWRNIFVRPDESLQDRRLKTVKRLRSRAEQSGLSVNLSNDGCLLVDDVLVFTLSQGWVVDAKNAARSSLFSRNGSS